jgi:hypothetical protein
MVQLHIQWQVFVLVILGFGFYYQTFSCLVNNYVHIFYKVVHIMHVINAQN